jgi:hypothetical protein
MKNAFRFVISSILAVTILLSGSSFTFGKMVCLETGYTIIDYKKVEDCCDRKTTEPSIYKAECCEITNVDLAVDNFVNTQNNFVNAAAAAVALHAFAGFATPVPAITHSQPIVLVQPPPEPPSDLLHSIRQYRI